MTGAFSNKIKNIRGFTLIEMIIALSLFVMAVLIIVNIYIVVNNIQRRTVAMQRVQDDVRYLFEAMAQEVRLGRMNYDFYADEDNLIDLHPNVDGIDNFVLAVINQSGERIFFRRSSGVLDANDGLGDKVQYCLITSDNDCDLFDEIDSEGKNKWQDITPNGVMVNDLKLIITPSVDPFGQVASGDLPSNCSVTPCPYGYECVNPDCRYYADGGNFQPKVRIVLTTESEDTSITEKSRTIQMQTVISSRVTQSKVQNDNY